MSPCGSISQPYRSVLKCLHISSSAYFYSVWAMPLSSSLGSHHIPVHVSHAASPSTHTPMPMLWYTRCHIAFFPSIWATGYCVCLFYLGVFKWEDLLKNEHSKELQRPKLLAHFHFTTRSEIDNIIACPNSECNCLVPLKLRLLVLLSPCHPWT